MNNLLLAHLLFTVVLLMRMSAAGAVVIRLVLFPLLRPTFLM